MLSLAVPCPTCKSPPLKACQEGNHSVKPHFARDAAASKQELIPDAIYICPRCSRIFPDDGRSKCGIEKVKDGYECEYCNSQMVKYERHD